MDAKEKKPLLSKSGLPVLPVKRMSPELLAEIKEAEERAKVKEKPVNLAEERIKLKEENERKIQLEEYRRK